MIWDEVVCSGNEVMGWSGLEMRLRGGWSGMRLGGGMVWERGYDLGVRLGGGMIWDEVVCSGNGVMGWSGWHDLE